MVKVLTGCVECIQSAVISLLASSEVQVINCVVLLSGQCYYCCFVRCLLFVAAACLRQSS